MRLGNVTQTKLNKKIKRFLNSLGGQTIIVNATAIAIVWLVALVPIWIFILTWWLASPVGFWQVFALISIGLFVGGGFQIAFVVFAVGISIHILLDH